MISWRSFPPSRGGAGPLRSWLVEAGSLTARCQAACGRFRVRLVACGRGAALRDEAFTLGGLQGRSWVREVVLECDGVPVIFAHTVLADRPRGRLTRWLVGLGSRSLGSLLFAYPGFARGGLEFLRVDRRHPLHGRASPYAPGADCFWARRSLHRLGGQQVLVTEVFLPAVADLGRAKRPSA